MECHEGFERFSPGDFEMIVFLMRSVDVIIPVTLAGESLLLMIPDNPG